MKTQQYHYVNKQLKNVSTSKGFEHDKAQLVLAFGEPNLIKDSVFFNQLTELFPKAQIVSSSTAGEIVNDDVYDDTVAVTAIQFEKTKVKCSIVKAQTDSYETGKELMKILQADDLSAVFVLADGTNTIGDELMKGFNENNSKAVLITGGMAGDGTRFVHTYIGVNSLPETGMTAAIGFYGKDIKIGHGCFGGWDEFGPEKIVTRSDKNIVYEIDGKNAVDIYNEYLGTVKDELPLNALLFPLALKRDGFDQHLIRTILLMDEEQKTMQVGGSLPAGSKVQFMKANFERLIEGSSVAAEKALTKFTDTNPQLAILVSCVGRRLILQKRTDEEVIAAREILGSEIPITGFYSYGEFSPLNASTHCELHNQTMTITTFSES